jgi:transcriptional/translational regulatory protein YebC/TACO1
VALGAGAEDIADEGEEWLVTTAPTEVDVVRKALEAAKIEVKAAQLVMIPKNTTQIAGRDAELVTRLIDVLDDHDDVQDVWSNFDLSEEEAARLGG